jgi:hypothetical protein
MFTPNEKPHCKLLIFSGVMLCSGDPAGIRTQDHYIKSVMLYQLSYGIGFFKAGAKIESL